MTTFAYDHRNRLTGVTRRSPGGSASAVAWQATYTYDALDRRIGAEVDADGAGGGAATRRWTAYDGSNPYADLDGSGAVANRYLHGPAVDFLLSRTSGSGTTAWYLPDRLGSIRNVADTAGSLTYTATYDSFGRVLSESGAGGDRFKYTGREYEAGAALYDYRARAYDPATGRFLQRDPIGFAGGDPNLHRYVGNSPTNATDPSGLASDPTNEMLDGMARRGRPLAVMSAATRTNLSRRTAGEIDVGVAAGQAFAQDLAVRGSGAMQVAGGIGEVVIGTPIAALSPEPITKVGGAAVAAHGVDNIQAGARQWATGEWQQTMTSQAIAHGAEWLGADPQTAATIGGILDAAIGLGGAWWGSGILDDLARSGSRPLPVVQKTLPGSGDEAARSVAGGADGAAAARTPPAGAGTRAQWKSQGGDVAPLTPAARNAAQFEALAQRRVQLGLPAAGAAEDAATLARMEINGQTFNGINRGLQNPPTPMTLQRVNAQTITHAEADVVQQAVDAGARGTARRAEMWVDRDPCGACGPSGGLRSLARNLAVDELVVHSPSGTQTFTPTR